MLPHVPYRQWTLSFLLWGLNWRLNSQLTARLVPAPNGVGLMLTWP